jgi:hypothetical protein
MSGIINVYKIFIEKPEGRRLVVGPRHSWGIILK